MKMNEKKIFLTLETLNEGPLAKVELTPEELELLKFIIKNHIENYKQFANVSREEALLKKFKVIRE